MANRKALPAAASAWPYWRCCAAPFSRRSLRGWHGCSSSAPTTTRTKRRRQALPAIPPSSTQRGVPSPMPTALCWPATPPSMTFICASRPAGTALRKTVTTIQDLTGSKDVETQLAAFLFCRLGGGAAGGPQRGQRPADRALPCRAGAERRGAAGGAGCAQLAGRHPAAPRAGLHRPLSPQSSGPPPGSAACRWMLSSAKAGWKPPMMTGCAARMGGCLSTPGWMALCAAPCSSGRHSLAPRWC